MTPITRLAVLLLLTFGACQANDSPTSESAKPTIAVVDRPEVYACDEDVDCISVQSGCCGCSAGGSAVAINKTFQEEWAEYWSGSVCKGTGCTAVVSTDASCALAPRCIKKVCALHEPSCAADEYTIYGTSCGEPPHSQLLACAPCKGMTADVGYVNRVTDNACFSLSSGGDVACLCNSNTANEWKECQ